MEEHPKKRESKRMAEDAMHLNFFSKKRKLYSELEETYCTAVSFAENEVSPAAPSTSGGDKCDVGRRLRSSDLENVDLPVSEVPGSEISSSTNNFFREGILTSGFSEDLERAILTADSSSASLKKPPRPATPVRKIPATAEKMPPAAAELDAFFAVVETHEQKRFAEKYNYDIVKDLPLKGRYQWVRLHL